MTNNNWLTLQIMLKKWSNLGKDWELSNIELVIRFSTKQKKVKELIELITDDEEDRDIIPVIYI